jgi:hypothetical protein
VIDTSISLPEYTVDEKPDSKNIGLKIDVVLRANFKGEVVIRCLSTVDHDLGLDELVEKIKETGTDKYDQAREGVGYFEGKQIDFFGLPADLSRDKPIMEEFIDDFYESAFQDRGKRMRIDLVLVYDKSKLEMVEHLYEGHAESDGFIFKDATNKPAALLGIIRILR